MDASPNISIPSSFNWQTLKIKCSIYALLFDRRTKLNLKVDLISKVPDLLLKLVVDTNLVDLVGEKEISINGAHSNHPKEKSDYSRNYINGYSWHGFTENGLRRNIVQLWKSHLESTL